MLCRLPFLLMLPVLHSHKSPQFPNKPPDFDDPLSLRKLALLCLHCILGMRQFAQSQHLAGAVRRRFALAVSLVVVQSPICSATSLGEIFRSRPLLLASSSFPDGGNTSATNDAYDGDGLSADPFAEEYDTLASSPHTTPPGARPEGGEESGLPRDDAHDAATDAFHFELLRVVRESVPIEDPAAAQNLLREAKSAREVRRVLDTVIYRSALAWDVLNGHGYRVAMIQTLTAIAPRCNAVAEWIECVSNFRALGFQCDRTTMAEGLNLIRAAAISKFQSDGRHPAIVSDGLNRLRTMVEWSFDDNIQVDHVFFSRLIAVATTLASLFDRQNVYRANFPDDFNRRDGIVFEWVVASTRCLDYDQAVLLCNQFVEEVLARMQDRIPRSRLSFGLFYRLMDYYFVTDQPEKMLAAMEDSPYPTAESSTAKLMQLACAFNLPSVPELFLKFRALPPQCVIASPDISRLLFYYGRAGGGKPCPKCGEAYNHRHPGLHIWEATPDAQKQCSLLATARTRKSELEDMGVAAAASSHQQPTTTGTSTSLHSATPPQNADHSVVARQLWQLSTERNIPWNALEWRGYLLCCMFSTKDVALGALKLLDEQLPESRFDEFLRQTYLRVLRTHHPEGLQEQMHRLFEGKPIQRVSPIILQEGLMTAAAMMTSAPQRLDCLRRVWKLVVERDTYVMPYTARFLRRQIERRDLMAMEGTPTTDGNGSPGSADASVHRQNSSGGHVMSQEERSLVEGIIQFKPRSVNLLDLKDGVSDFVVGSTKKNVFVQSHEERAKRDSRDSDRAQRAAKATTAAPAADATPLSGRGFRR